jgi:hypothetical protein
MKDLVCFLKCLKKLVLTAFSILFTGYKSDIDWPYKKEGEVESTICRSFS